MNRYLPWFLLSSLILIFGVRLYFEPVFERKNVFLSNEKERLSALIRSFLPGDEGALASGMLLGGSSDLSVKAKTAFRRAGMSHVVAASGYNVTLVAGVLIATGRGLMNRKYLILFVILSVLLYMYLAGMTASVVRAGIMAITTYIASLFGRPVDGKWTLVLVSLWMLIISPGYIDDIGFLLSVTATWGILESGHDALNQEDGKQEKVGLLIKLRKTFFGDLKTTVFAQIFTLPIILHYFGQVSVVAPVANALLLWIVPIVMQIAAVALGVGLWWPDMGQLISYLVWPLLRLMNQTVIWFSNQSWAAFEVAKISWSWVMAYYLLLIIGLRKWRSIWS